MESLSIRPRTPKSKPGISQESGRHGCSKQMRRFLFRRKSETRNPKEFRRPKSESQIIFFWTLNAHKSAPPRVHGFNSRPNLEVEAFHEPIGVGRAVSRSPSLRTGRADLLHPLSCVPWLHGRYPLRRYHGCSDSRRAALRALPPGLRLTPAGLPDYGRWGLPAIPSPTISVSSGDRPAVRRFGSPPIARSTGFVLRSQTGPFTPT